MAVPIVPQLLQSLYQAFFFRGTKGAPLRDRTRSARRAGGVKTLRRMVARMPREQGVCIYISLAAPILSFSIDSAKKPTHR
jgi:hypothetical protein